MWHVIQTAIITFIIIFLLHHIYEHLTEVLTPPVVEVKRHEEYDRIEKIIKPDMKDELAEFMEQLQRS
jgi:hypothetical protein